MSPEKYVRQPGNVLFYLKSLLGKRGSLVEFRYHQAHSIGFFYILQ